MSKAIATVLAPAVLALVAFSATSAGAWERNAKTEGPYGRTVSSHGSGSCSGGSCSSYQSVTGRYGGRVSRHGSTSCSGGGCNGSATYTGPAGKTVTRTRAFRR